MTDRIRVLIADDQALFAGSLKVVLEGHGGSDIEVVGIARDGKEAVRLAEEAEPDVVLMDVRMPTMDGVEATRQIAARFPAIKIMILTTFEDDDYVLQALENGATGYVLKNIQPDDLVTSVKAVFGGTLLFTPSVGMKLIQHARTEREGPASPVAGVENLRASSAVALERLRLRFPMLTHREIEVLHLIGLNYDNHEIADRLFIAEQTVKNYTSRIYDRLGVPDRLHLLRLMRELTSDPPPDAGSPSAGHP